MAFTQFLISRGGLNIKSMYRCVKYVLVAGVFGYLGGKMSYMKTCQEKFKSLENSPLGEALRQRQRQHHQPPVKLHFYQILHLDHIQYDDQSKDSVDRFHQHPQIMHSPLPLPGSFHISPPHFTL
uniref:OCIA domain-containing protein 1 n=1 Tax=Sinocyclocheilus grahami TaxID=75366 RepID=A0A672SQK8_SINGR